MLPEAPGVSSTSEAVTELGMLMRTVSIDLVICTYNNAQLLDGALEAISKQEVPPSVTWRVLVVNNNCIDHTTEVVRAHQAQGRIPHLREVLEAREGLSHARRCGIEYTTAAWVAFVDEDALLDPDWVAEAAAFAHRHPACGAFGGRVVPSWDAPPPVFAQRYGYAFAAQDYGDVSGEVPWLVGTGMVVRREALFASGWMARSYVEDGMRAGSGCDAEMILRIRATGAPLLYHPKCRLVQVIPRRRTSLRYLMDVNYGRGRAGLSIDAMLWSGTYRTWLRSCAGRTLRTSFTALGQSLSAVVKRRPKVDAAMTWSFVGGSCAGLWYVVRMEPRVRRAFLGCALPAAPADPGDAAPEVMAVSPRAASNGHAEGIHINTYPRSDSNGAPPRSS